MSTELIAMDAVDAESLKIAHQLLQNPGWVARASSMIGKPIESGLESLPDKAKVVITEAVKKAMDAALAVALRTMDNDSPEVKAEPPKASNWWHKAAAATSGAVGGAFGFAALAIELPVSTTIMMRSIADVARSEGADLSDTKMQLECVTILAYGGSTKNDDGTEVGYFAVRQALTAAFQEAATHIATQGVSSSAPALVRLIGLIAQRFSIQSAEKAAAQLIPVLGAISGAAINTAFIDHFQDMARGHFIRLRLEKKYGLDFIQTEYEKLPQLAKPIESQLELSGSASA